jgi:O-antigen/teichoic acid export membrane protein
LTGSSSADAVVRRAGLNVGKLLSGKAGAGVASLLYTLVTVRVLGPHDYGVLILVHTFALTIGGLLAAPGGQAVVRYGAQAASAGDPGRLLRLLRFCAVVEVSGGLFAVVVAVIAASLVGPRLGWSQTAVDFALPYSFAVFANGQATASGYLQLCGRFDLLAGQLLVAPLARLFGACLVWLTGGGLHDFLVVWLLAALLQWASLWALGLHVLRRRLARAPLRGSMRGIRADNPGIWRFMLAVKLDVTLSDLAPRLTSLIVGAVLGPSAAGLFAVAQRPSKVVAQPANMFAQTTFAEFARIAAGAERGATILGVLVRSCALMLGLALPILLILAVAAHPLTRLLGGASFVKGGDVVPLLALARTADLIAPSARAALVALGRPGLGVIANLAGYLAVLTLPFLLAVFGLIGAGFQAVLQALVVSTVLAYFVWANRGATEPLAAQRERVPPRRWYRWLRTQSAGQQS